jgi:anti-sigma factor RsiW
MHSEFNDRMMRALDQALTPEETRVLREHLRTCTSCAREWAALLNAHETLSAAPLLAPPAGFTDRVLTRVAMQQERSSPLAVFVKTVLVLAAIVIAALIVAALPLTIVFYPGIWAALLQTCLSFVALLTVLLDLAFALARLIAALIGGGTLLALTLFAILLFVIWVRLVSNPAPFNRLIRATEA